MMMMMMILAQSCLIHRWSTKTDD